MVIESIIATDMKDKAIKRYPIKAWVQALQNELAVKEPGSALKENESGGTTLPGTGAVRPKVEFKLEIFEGTEEGCAIWYHGMEKQMNKLRISEEDFMAYAINSTGGRARTTINMLDDRYI